jgi:hypothetical protein
MRSHKEYTHSAAWCVNNLWQRRIPGRASIPPGVAFLTERYLTEV